MDDAVVGNMTNGGSNWLGKPVLPNIGASRTHGLCCGVYECLIVPLLDSNEVKSSEHTHTCLAVKYNTMCYWGEFGAFTRIAVVNSPPHADYRARGKMFQRLEVVSDKLRGVCLNDSRYCCQQLVAFRRRFAFSNSSWEIQLRRVLENRLDFLKP